MTHIPGGLSIMFLGLDLFELENSQMIEKNLAVIKKCSLNSLLYTLCNQILTQLKYVIRGNHHSTILFVHEKKM